MAQQTRWILTLAAAGLLLAGAVLASNAYVDLLHAERAVAEQEIRARSLQAGLRKVKQIKKDVERFARTMNEAESVGLKPGVWIDYPVDISRELSWGEVSNIIGMASKGGPRGKGYWYGPKSFTFSLIQGNNEEDGETAGANIHLGINGEFLMPKPGNRGAGGWYAPWFENLRQIKDAYSVKQ